MHKIIKYLFADKPNNFTTIVIALLTSIATIYGKDKIYQKFTLDLNQKTSQVASQTQQVVLGAEVDASTPNTPTIDKNTLSSFDISSWYTYADQKPNKDGFYCPKNLNFPYWYMWTSKRFNLKNEIVIVFTLLDKTKDDKNPTFYVMYGDKSNSKPDSFFRLNMFDGDPNTLRLYDRQDNVAVFERSVNSPNFEDYITLKLNPVFINPNSTIIRINPSISFKVANETYTFNPKSDYSIDLPLPTQEDIGEGFQIGVGVSEGDCFKVTSTSLN